MNEGRRPATTLEILMFITALGGIALALVGGLTLGGLGFVSAAGGDSLGALTGLWTMSAALAVAVALVPATYWSGRAVFGYPPPGPGRPSSMWLVPVLGYPACLALGWAAHVQGKLPLLLGPLGLVGTALLSVLFLGWVVRRLGPPISPLRSWGHFTVGLTAMPLSAMVVEFLAIIPVVFIFAIWLLTSPEGQAWASTLSQSLPDPDQAMQDASAFLQSPVVLVGIYGYVGVAIPVIEETIKTMAVWPFLRRGLSPAEAFLGGALGGAGYALFEALFLTQPGESWIATTLVRIGATALHMFTAALTSYGLMQVVRRRRYAVGLWTFAGAIAMHALWNLGAVTIGISSVPITTSSPPPIGALSGVAAMILLGLATLSGLGLVLAWSRLPRGAPGPA